MKRRSTTLATLLLAAALTACLAWTPGVTAFGGPTCEGDIDGNGSVDIFDILAVISQWGVCPDPPEECTADLDADGEVGINDLIVVLQNYGPCEGEGCVSNEECDDGNDCTFDLCLGGVCYNFPIPNCE